MARPLRIQKCGAWYHVTARGNERRAIYRDQRDRNHFCELLAELVERYRWRLLAYVLMNNHYHLMVETAEANLSRGMQWLNVSYSVWFNRRHQRVGHLFQARYRAFIIDRLGWGLEVSRYVHLNPVRVERLGLGKGQRQMDRLGVGATPTAKLVRERIERLRAYRWSSYRAYVGLEPAPAWLSRQSVLELLGGKPGAKQRQAYREHVESAVRPGLPESPWEKVIGQVILGGREFVRGLRGKLTGNAREQPGLRKLTRRPKLEDVIQVVERLKGQKWEQFRDQYGDTGRDLVLWFGRKRCGLQLRMLARWVGDLDYTAVSLAVKRFEQRRRHDKGLQSTITQVDTALDLKP
jgi:REP element-mobilizing transposase RayT